MAAGLTDTVINSALDRMKTPDVKNRLKDYTDQAVAHGVTN